MSDRRAACAVHLVVGTRPEAVKMAPLVLELRAVDGIEPVIVTTGQHTELVIQALAAFGLAPDVVLPTVRHLGTQAELVGSLTPLLDGVIAAGSACVVVQGDTTSALVGGLVAFWRRLPLVHLEAGLRTGDRTAPFPEETNRVLLASLADLHLAPTERAVTNLRREGVDPHRVLLVGNTAVDAIMIMVEDMAKGAGPPLADPRLQAVEADVLAGRRRLMLATAHRRESWGGPLDRVIDAIRQIVDEHDDVVCVVPAHGNPAVRRQVGVLSRHPRVVVTAPLPYRDNCRLLARSTLVLTDSGGIQEEAPTFGVPVLIVREATERPEAVAAGTAEVVGTDSARIVAAAKEILGGDPPCPTGVNPFGDGHAAWRSARAIADLLDRTTTG